MTAPKGHPKWGGRRKGSLNKGTLTFRQQLERILGTSIASAILKLAESVQPKDRLNCLIQLLPYCYPRLTNVEETQEITINGGDPELQKRLDDYLEVQELKKVMVPPPVPMEKPPESDR